MKYWFLVLFLVFLPGSCARRTPNVDIPTFSENEYLVREVRTDSGTYRYRLYVPPDRTPGEKLPVMLYLHGSDDRGDDNQLQLRGVAEHFRSHPNDFHFIIVFPQCPTDRFWDKELIPRAMAALDQTVKKLNGDESRLYVAGFSLGGYGTWAAAAMYPGKFAAIVPMSGRILARPGERKNAAPEIIGLAESSDPYAAFANRIGKTPVWVFHGANDNIVPVEGSRKMVQALKDAGNQNVQYNELEGIAHYSLDSAFSNPELFKWLSTQALNNN